MKKTGFRGLSLSIVGFILFCAIPCTYADVRCDDGGIHFINYSIAGSLFVDYGTIVNIGGEASVSESIYIDHGSTVDIYALEPVPIIVSIWIDCTVTVYGRDFNFPYGENTLSLELLTGYDENDNPIEMIVSGPIILAPPTITIGKVNLDFIEGVKDYTIVSANKREDGIDVFGDILLDAYELILDENSFLACKKLDRAYDTSDGDKMELIQGEDVQDLNDDILELMGTIGCTPPVD